MIYARLSSLSLVALLLGCTSPEPDTPAAAPKSTATPTAAPTPTPMPTPTATPTPTPTPTATAGAPGGLPWESLAEGVVPRAKIEDVALASPDPPILSRAARCDGGKSLDGCNYGGTEILGFGARGVLLSYTPEGGHPEIWPVIGEVVGLDGKSLERTEVTRTGELEGREYTQARLKGWKWYAKMAKAGFTPPEPLMWAGGAFEIDDAPHVPVVFLKAPLAGWMLYIAPPVGDEKLVQLVAPDNKRAYTLARLPVEKTEKCFDEGGSVVACTTQFRYERANIDDVALDPTRKHLVLLYTLYSPEGRVDRSRWAVYQLPPEVVPAG